MSLRVYFAEDVADAINGVEVAMEGALTGAILQMVSSGTDLSSPENHRLLLAMRVGYLTALNSLRCHIGESLVLPSRDKPGVAMLIDQALRLSQDNGGHD